MTTPSPVYLPGPGPACAPTSMPLPERTTYRAAAFRATKLYPGPIGELVERELRAFDEFGYRIACDSLLARVRDQIDADWRASSLT